LAFWESFHVEDIELFTIQKYLWVKTFDRLVMFFLK